MIRSFFLRPFIYLLFSTAFLIADLSAKSQTVQPYSPVPLPSGNQVSDTLSDKDIPTGDGGFARDYSINLEKGDQVAIDLISDDFDSMLTLISEDGTTISENDDGPDGTTNSLLFARINESGKYIIRVRAFGETSSGKFTLKVTRLKPVNN